jgi:hypothetical protein
MAYCGPRGIALSDFLRWSRKDQEAALEWATFEARRCRSCGTHPDEWAEDRLAYHAHLHGCPGCRQLQRLSDSDQAKEQGDGVTAVMAGGSAGDCPQCKPFTI